MKVYEAILSILEKNGPMPIPGICHELNKVLNSPEPLKPHQIHSIVTRKKDLFHINGERISIHPDKNPVSLLISLDGFGGASYKVHINFLKERFTFLEWRSKETVLPFTDFNPSVFGSINDFKREIYTMKIWEWEHDYQKSEGIILEGIYWYVKLTTRAKVYESTGTDCFPDNWNTFFQAVEKLTGVRFR